jgi:hypothetical protein
VRVVCASVHGEYNWKRGGGGNNGIYPPPTRSDQSRVTTLTCNVCMLLDLTFCRAPFVREQVCDYNKMT